MYCMYVCNVLLFLAALLRFLYGVVFLTEFVYMGTAGLTRQALYGLHPAAALYTPDFPHFQWYGPLFYVYHPGFLAPLTFNGTVLYSMYTILTSLTSNGTALYSHIPS